MKFYFLLFGCYTVLALAIIFGYKNKKQFNYPSATFFKVYGLDASHHQGKVDWTSVGNTDYKFIYLKATEAETFRDKRFLKNYKAAKQAGLAVGGYHFWSLCKPLITQFENLKAVIPKERGDLVPALDIESTKSCEEKRAVGVLTLEMIELNQLFLEFYGALPLIYTTPEFSGQYPEILDLPNKFWLRSLVGPPTFSRNWVLWQYYSAGSVEGFKGPVDLNVMRSEVSLDSILQR